MNYSEWKKRVPATIQKDTLWDVEAYRLSLFAADISWRDAGKLAKNRRTKSLSSQLYRSVGSIGANIAEGYSRKSRKDQARFYEYALGSARESRDWYFKGRHVLGDKVVTHRLDLISQVIRLLLVMVPQQREDKIGESTFGYERTDSTDEHPEIEKGLLEDIPFAS